MDILMVINNITPQFWVLLSTLIGIRYLVSNSMQSDCFKLIHTLSIVFLAYVLNLGFCFILGKQTGIVGTNFQGKLACGTLSTF